ncbi:MAG: polysaccharide biosynthesis tyrosine autokinase [Terracidiphilus sp.]
MNFPASEKGFKHKPRRSAPLGDYRGNGAFEHHVAGELSLAELWRILLKRKSTFFLCLSAAVVLAIFASLILPVRYEGVAKLTLDFDSNALQDVMANMSGGADSADLKLQTQVKVLETDSLVWQVIRNLRLDQRPEAAPRMLGIGPVKCLSSTSLPIKSITPDCRYLLLYEFHRRFKVQALPRTQIIEIRYRSRSRELAAQVVNAITDEYTQTSFQAKYGAALRASKWVSGQLDEVKSNAENAEEKYIAYQKQTGIIGTDENHNVLIERLDAINQQLVVAEAARIVREARYRESLNGDPEALVEMAPGSPLLVLHSEQAALQSEYAQLESKFGEAYPRVQQLKAQLDKATASLNAEIARSRKSIQSEYEAALQSEQLLRKEFEEQKQQAYDTSEATVQVALLKRDVDASRDLYEQLVKQLNESGILAGLRSTNVTVIDPATVPVERAEPNLRINLLFGLIAGSVLGLGMCFLLENLNSTILSPHDVSDASTLPVIGVVPRLTDKNALGRNESKDGTARIAALERPNGAVAEAYRSLRTALLLSNATSPPKTLLITSALPREGKTTTSINLAAVFSQKEQRVLLVDGDMRRADLYSSLGLPRGGGLSAALVGQDHRQFYAHHKDLPNLFILPAGDRPPQPPDLLDSDRMRELLAIWRNEFDRVIIDAPPVIGLSDSVILATMADAVVLVLRANQSRRQDFNLAQEILTGVDANICGAIINDFHLSSSYSSGYSAKLYGSYFDEKGEKERA